MDAVRVALLREVLAGTEWLSDTRRFAGSLRASVTPHEGALLLVGTEEYEPWHLAAHLDDEAAWSGLPELVPTLVRHRVPQGVPARLSVGLGRIEAAGRAETLLVVAPDEPDAELLERVHDARRAGARIFALNDATGGGTSPSAPCPPHADGPAAVRGGRTASGTASELLGLAHDALTADASEIDLDTVQHLVSAAAGENGLPAAGPRRRFRDRLSLLADRLTSPPPARW